MSKEAMKLALEALENSVDLVREDACEAEKLYGNYPTRQGKVNGLKVLADDHEKAITALREALATQPAPVQQEPVGEVGEIDIDEDGQAFAWLALHKNVDIGDKLYTHPQPAQRPQNCGTGYCSCIECLFEQQEPVAWPCVIAEADFSENTVTLAMQCTDYKVSAGKHWLYTSPQPAQRKPLTTQEIREWWASENGLEDCEMSKLDDFEDVVRAIEAAHGIGEKK